MFNYRPYSLRGFSPFPLLDWLCPIWRGLGVTAGQSFPFPVTIAPGLQLQFQWEAAYKNIGFSGITTPTGIPGYTFATGNIYSGYTGMLFTIVGPSLVPDPSHWRYRCYLFNTLTGIYTESARMDQPVQNVYAYVDAAGNIIPSDTPVTISGNSAIATSYTRSPAYINAQGNAVSTGLTYAWTQYTCSDGVPKSVAFVGSAYNPSAFSDGAVFGLTMNGTGIGSYSGNLAALRRDLLPLNITGYSTAGTGDAVFGITVRQAGNGGTTGTTVLNGRLIVS